MEAPEEDQSTDAGLEYGLISQLESKPVGKRFKLAQQQLWNWDDKAAVHMLMIDNPDNRTDQDAEKVAVESYYTDGQCGHIAEEKRMKVTHRIYIKESIGRGGYGIVYKAEVVGPQFQDRLCLKMALHRRQYKSEREKDEGQKKINQSIIKEAEIFSKLSKYPHQNIIGYKFHCTTQKENEMLIGLEYFEGMSLEKTIKMFKKKGHGRLPSKTLHKIMMDTTCAVEYLLDLGIVHCDIKPQNILYSCCEPEKVKLIDFGCAVQLDKTPSVAEATGGTPEYMAPEALLTGRSGIIKESDISGLGSLFYLLVTFKIPWHHCEEVTIARQQKNSSEVWRLIKLKYKSYAGRQLSAGAMAEPTELQALITKKASSYYISQSLECKLINDMLSFDMNKRPSCDKILKYIDTKCKDENTRRACELALGSCNSEYMCTSSNEAGFENSDRSNLSTVPSDVKKAHEACKSPKPIVHPESESADSFAPPLPPRNRKRGRRGPTLSMDATSTGNLVQPPLKRSRMVAQGPLLPEKCPPLSQRRSLPLATGQPSAAALPPARGLPLPPSSSDEDVEFDTHYGAAARPDEAPFAVSSPSPHDVGAASDVYESMGRACRLGQNQAEHYSGHIGDGLGYQDAGTTVQATDSIYDRMSHIDLGADSDEYEV